MRHLILAVAFLPTAAFAQKRAVAKNYTMPSSIDLYKNGQVITYQYNGVMKSDTLYDSDTIRIVSANNVRITTDHGPAMLPDKKR